MLRKVNVVFDGMTEGKPETVQMPSYPQDGYVQMIDQVVVVKWNEKKILFGRRYVRHVLTNAGNCATLTP